MSCADSASKVTRMRFDSAGRLAARRGGRLTPGVVPRKAVKSPKIPLTNTNLRVVLPENVVTKREVARASRRELNGWSKYPITAKPDRPNQSTTDARFVMLSSPVATLQRTSSPINALVEQIAVSRLAV
jgi:hypothetical protein